MYVHEEQNACSDITKARVLNSILKGFNGFEYFEVLNGSYSFKFLGAFFYFFGGVFLVFVWILMWSHIQIFPPAAIAFDSKHDQH